MRRLLRLLSLFSVPALAALAARTPPPLGSLPLVALARGDDAALLAFEVLDGSGSPIPARLTFVGPLDEEPDLFSTPSPAPLEIAARKNVVYARSGRARIAVPSGHYRIFASRGLEWSLDSTELELVAGKEASWTARLDRELDTRGWVGGDFHLHTLTHSGHGDANLEERVIALLGEGVEFAVATDHDHHTDYAPTMAALEVGAGELSAVTGNEVTTSIGHMNAFPLDPARTPVDSSLTDANELFRLIRAEKNAFGVVPVIQLNHPRWGGIDYFTQTGLDPATGTGAGERYSRDFDSIEILNENDGGGYLDPIADRVDTKGNTYSVLRDWFQLLNRGERYAAVGNSDSHTVQLTIAGFPRNFVRSASDVPGEIEPAEIADAVREKRTFTTLGPFVEFSVEGVPMGGTVTARDAHATLALRVQAASWIDCDRVKVVVDGDVVATLPVPETRTPLRLETSLELCLARGCERHDPGAPFEPHDSWVALLVEGDDPLAPIVGGRNLPARPIAIANPVWIDGDGDGRWTAPAARVRGELATRDVETEERREWFAALRPSERVLALSCPDLVAPPELVERGLADAERSVRLAAARAAEKAGGAAFARALTALDASADEDPFLAALVFRALASVEDPVELLFAYQQRFGDAALRRYGNELLGVLGGTEVTHWLALGCFDADDDHAQEPATDPDPARRWTGRGGREIAWRPLLALADSGFVDLTALAGEGEKADRAVAYAQAWIFSEDRREVACSFGADDGCRVWLGAELVYENLAKKRAHPLEKLARLELEPGWNRLVLQVENSTGAFGLYCRVLDPEVLVSSEPP